MRFGYGDFAKLLTGSSNSVSVNVNNSTISNKKPLALPIAATNTQLTITNASHKQFLDRIRIAS